MTYKQMIKTIDKTADKYPELKEVLTEARRLFQKEQNIEDIKSLWRQDTLKEIYELIGD